MRCCLRCRCVSVLFNEPKLLKLLVAKRDVGVRRGFSALQRAEIAEIKLHRSPGVPRRRFSALQRAEIAEIVPTRTENGARVDRFSALQRAEIAEIASVGRWANIHTVFQCSSTSRNC